MINPGKKSKYVFCRDFGTITESNVAGLVTVEFSASVPVYGSLADKETVLQFSEAYEPDASGTIYIRDLGALMERFAPRLGLRELFSDGVMRRAGTGMSITTTSDGSSSSQSTADFLYSSVKTQVDYSVEEPLPFFLTRYTSRSVFTGQYCELSFLNLAGHLQVCAIYRDAPRHAAAAKWVLNWEHDGPAFVGRCAYVTYPFGTDVIVRQLNDAVHGDYTVDDLIEYTVTLYHQDGQPLDSVRFTVDHDQCPHAVTLFYQNCFGLTETMVLRGIDTIAADMQGTFGHVGDAYRKLQTELNWENAFHTGPIDRYGRAAFSDLLRSPQVFLGDLAPEHEVVITDVDAEEVVPHTAPVDYVVKWRLSDAACPGFDRKPVRKDVGGVFDESFDKSFE